MFFDFPPFSHLTVARAFSTRFDLMLIRLLLLSPSSYLNTPPLFLHVNVLNQNNESSLSNHKISRFLKVPFKRLNKLNIIGSFQCLSKIEKGLKRLSKSENKNIKKNLFYRPKLIPLLPNPVRSMSTQCVAETLHETGYAILPAVSTLMLELATFYRLQNPTHKLFAFCS